MVTSGKFVKIAASPDSQGRILPNFLLRHLLSSFAIGVKHPHFMAANIINTENLLDGTKGLMSKKHH